MLVIFNCFDQTCKLDNSHLLTEYGITTHQSLIIDLVTFRPIIVADERVDRLLHGQVGNQLRRVQRLTGRRVELAHLNRDQIMRDHTVESRYRNRTERTLSKCSMTDLRSYVIPLGVMTGSRMIVSVIGSSMHLGTSRSVDVDGS